MRDLTNLRVIGTSEEWNGGSDATREVVNKLDADFVSTIRSLGGNNKLRHLMIPGLCGIVMRGCAEGS